MRCSTCQHWTPPSERTDFGHAVTIRSAADHYDKVLSEAAYAAETEADKTFGICKAIDLCELTHGEPIPLATTRDASDYIATLYTRPEFGCAMWTAPSRIPSTSEGRGNMSERASSAEKGARTCAGCGEPLRLTVGGPMQVWTCETADCGGNLTHLDRVACRHEGGTDDCPSSCWLVHGERFTRVTSPGEGDGS